MIYDLSIKHSDIGYSVSETTFHEGIEASSVKEAVQIYREASLSDILHEKGLKLRWSRVYNDREHRKQSRKSSKIKPTSKRQRDAVEFLKDYYQQ